VWGGVRGVVRKKSVIIRGETRKDCRQGLGEVEGKGKEGVDRRVTGVLVVLNKT
jgi:hypothetical protein